MVPTAWDVARILKAPCVDVVPALQILIQEHRASGAEPTFRVPSVKAVEIAGVGADCCSRWVADLEARLVVRTCRPVFPSVGPLDGGPAHRDHRRGFFGSCCPGR